MVPPLLALVALETEALRQALGPHGRMAAAGAAALALAHAAFWVMRGGPFT